VGFAAFAAARSIATRCVESERPALFLSMTAPRTQVTGGGV